ncbi:site-specific integrase [Paracoccus saliphilus]|uniref:Site-specific recombinase XerD n=1 Tax=Paracoccus saliphilus TaxID=405559 RepID=A0AA46A5S8_9RHOB|nr:site-specific integrase [Paracoccus saliphilus]WCR04551.1 tyrosine-type recombinase/integrase [Paracoccus saliphilus]SIS86663.1 Site-specific recombinase XerD [Paracoccus saliphilus]
MPERKRIGLRDIRALQRGQTIYDASVTGFGARRQRSEAVSYIVVYRTAEGRQRMQTIGRHGSPWTPDEAREEARRILGEVAQGRDPAADRRNKREAPTISDLTDIYMADAENGRLLTRRGIAKKPSTIATDRSRIDAHIKPLLGSMKVAAVSRNDVKKFMAAVAEGKTHRRVRLDKPRAISNVRGGKGSASRTVGLLGALFTYAQEKGWRDDNPVRGVTRYADGKRNRRLSAAEYKSLGDALHGLSVAEHGAIWPDAIACVRFLALTGWRRGEALNLRWRAVDLETRTATLHDTKTGASIRPLSHRACDVLQAMVRGEPGALVFRPARGNTIMSGLPKYMKKIVAVAGLPPDVTAHVLRHSFASVAADGGASELTIAALLGHRAGSVTSRYTHHADAVLLAAADKVADKIAEAMGEPVPTGEIINLDEVRG